MAVKTDTIADVLIVEDELVTANALADVLSDLGYKVLEIVDSSDKAISAAKAHMPDVILMDIKLKGADSGIIATNEIHKISPVPVIYLTAFSDADTLQKAIATSPYGYLTKPLRYGEVNVAIMLALKKHREEQLLQEALEKEKELHILKSRLLAMASHEFSTPMSVIRLLIWKLQNFEEQLTKEGRAKNFDSIQSAIKDINWLLEEIKFIACSESGKFPFKPESVDAISYCQQLVENLQTEENSRKCQIKFHSKGECQKIKVDKKLLWHIFMNLISNAIKYSYNGGTIEIEIECTDKSLVLSIADQGIGIPEQYLNDLFLPFLRAENVGSIKGLGMGLYIVKQAVEAHHGKITVESEVNMGTKFTVVLPSDLSLSKKSASLAMQEIAT
ncbi:hybrid sensor histidine kinase/response regulator [Pseudanabaena mucicola]|uniref:histidine kinase n=1 Tax=Pseudanabaena mucicola FACHB-723 TaxID=2692860 RepID=A0ABR7ZXJ9_9CYAN|nr:ATP-binding protein [Pseudanabaena mucicola]MBD2188515.1 response regulator [Pseudanabaena mucicola FACHB-723]